ncbi:MAG: aminodeoxychorismate synthase component I [Caldilineae bacterium]|nr:MAG: aminodeoxychorismate synthase component I [Caldilineae bacterium]
MNRVILRDEEQQRWLHFGEAVAVVEAYDPGQVREALARVERAVHEQGLYAAGYLAYEAAPAFDPALRVHPPIPSLPLLWFGLYRRPQALPDLPLPPAEYTLGPWRASMGPEHYADCIDRIRHYIAAGDTYQVNFTFPLHAAFAGDPLRFFADLHQAQQAAYAAYLEMGRWVICSASPELFFALEGERIVARPMKGTAARGYNLQQDARQMRWLQGSEKNRAENVMIVDMIRNDLGRVAVLGSVEVPRLYEVERYPTVLQMTSTVTARTEAPLTAILAALFPCASITGAPKVRTMEIITELETAPRGVYTGAIGFIAPGRRARFNVAIRTVAIDREAGRATYGVGGGIVWDSQAAAEYEECRLKAGILLDAPPSFELLESLLWQPATGYYLLEHHLRRLADAATYFCIPLQPQTARTALSDLAATLPPCPHKVRLLVSRSGRVRVEAAPLETPTRPCRWRIGLAREPITSTDPFLYFKTTRRQVYERALAGRPDCDDVLLWNERGELTEATRANLLVRLDGRWYTPPVSSGLLAGTCRGQLLAEGRIHERVIRVQELPQAQALALINSVRGWMEAEWVEEPLAVG